MELLSFTSFNSSDLVSKDSSHRVLHMDANSIKKRAMKRSASFRFLALPAETRNNIYHFIFTPTSSADKHTSCHSTILGFTYVEPNSPAQEKLRKIPGLHYSRPANYQVLFTSHRLYNEALPVLAKSTSLHLSGTTYRHIKSIIGTNPNFRYLAELHKAVAHHTSSLILDQPVFQMDRSFTDDLVSDTLFPHLKRITMHHAGPAELSYNHPGMALSAAEARRLINKKQWPAEKFRLFFTGATLRSINEFKSKIPIIVPLRWNPFRVYHESFPIILQNLRKQFDEKYQHVHDQTEGKKMVIEIVWSLPIKDQLTTTPPCNHLILDKAEITVDFDTDDITDVTFSKKYMMTTAATIINGETTRNRQWALFTPTFRSFWAKPE